MKKLFIILSAMMFSIGMICHAQVTDTASTNYQNDLEQAGDESEEGAERTGKEIEEGAERTGDEIQEGAEATDQELEEATNQMEDKWDGSTLKKDAEDDGDKIESGADETGDKASQVSKTAAAEIKDEKLESKTGPNGEPVFINEHAEYYYINNNGEKVKVKKSELKAK